MNQVRTIGFIRSTSLIQKMVLSKSFWFAILMFGFSYPIYRSVNRKIPDNLPYLYKIPDFELTNQFNRNFGSKDLQGKVYLANFIFTSCPSSCPLIMKKVQIIQKRLRGLGTRVAILSFSVDPENDTPRVLNEFALSYKANPFVWTFLTGSFAKVNKLLINGFKVVMGTKDSSLLDIAHSEKIILVDGQGMARGVYSFEKEEIDQMMIDIGILINKGVKI